MAELLAGRYELIAKVADGALATVWRGMMRGEHGLARPVAVRFMREPWDRDRTILAAWASSATELALIGSREVEQILDIFVADDRGVVVSEWIEGVSLRRFLRAYASEKRAIPWPLAATIAIEVLRGLASAHEASPPLCHEGIDAKSVRISKTGTVKLTRFAAAAALAVRGADRRELEGLGLRHAAPELARGERPTPASDLFGVGALAFEMLAGRPAFPVAGAVRDAAVRACDFPDLASLRPDVPALALAEIERALRIEASDRRPSARAMIDALARLLQNEVEPVGPEALAEAVRAVLDRPKPEATPKGLVAERTMYVDLAELTVLPNAPAAGEPGEGSGGSSDRRPRYRFGYKERRAHIAARNTPDPSHPPPIQPQESEAAPLPLTRRTEAAVTAKRPSGLVQHPTEFLDADQVDRLTLPDPLGKKR